jgi:uncharacterized membrane protein
MMRTILILLLLVVARPAAATEEYILPTLFDVTGVRPTSHLNIRSGPGTGFAKVGTFAPDAQRIEVVAHDASGQWGQVNTGEGSAWVSLQYLAYRTDVWEAGALPAGFRCFGNEPFWSFDATTFSTPEAQDQPLTITSILDSGIFRDPRRALIATSGGTRYTATVTPQACSDGMSDRAFGLSTMVVVEEGATPPVLLNGCCSIAP